MSRKKTYNHLVQLAYDNSTNTEGAEQWQKHNYKTLVKVKSKVIQTLTKPEKYGW